MEEKVYTVADVPDYIAEYYKNLQISSEEMLNYINATDNAEPLKTTNEPLPEISNNLEGFSPPIIDNLPAVPPSDFVYKGQTLSYDKLTVKAVMPWDDSKEYVITGGVGGISKSKKILPTKISQDKILSTRTVNFEDNALCGRYRVS